VLGRTTTSVEGDASATAGSALKVTIVLDEGTASLLDASRLGLPDVDVRVHSGTLASLTANGPLLRATNVLIAQIDPGNPRDFEEFERFVRDHKERLPVIAAVRDLSVAVTRRVLRSDAVDVLPIPFTPDELHQAIETGRHRLAVSRPQGAPRAGRVVTFLGALGGSGTTTVATQAAMIWAEKQSVCLIDLDLQFGNAALYLNLRPQLSLADLMEAGDRLDAEFLRSVGERHSSGVTVIASPPEVMPLDSVTPEFVDRLLDLAADAFDVVLVDMPGAWVAWSLSALRKSDAICLITGLSVPGVHQARRQLEVLDANALGERVRIVLNRVVHPMFGKADLSETEKVLRHKVDFPISNDYPTVSSAIDEGRLISSIKVKSRVEKDLRVMIGQLSTMANAEAETS
jgi:pilus assembly protein CpaE